MKSVTVDALIRLSIVISIIAWVSFTIYIIIPKLQGVEMTIGLGSVIGIITATFAWLENKEKSRSHDLTMKRLEK